MYQFLCFYHKNAQVCRALTHSCWTIRILTTVIYATDWRTELILNAFCISNTDVIVTWYIVTFVQVYWFSSSSYNVEYLACVFLRTGNRRMKFDYIRNQRPSAAARPPTEMTLMTSLLVTMLVIIIRVHRVRTVTSVRTSHRQHNWLLMTTSSGARSALFAAASAPRSLRHNQTVTSQPPTTNHGAASPTHL